MLERNVDQVVGVGDDRRVEARVGGGEDGGVGGVGDVLDVKEEQPPLRDEVLTVDRVLDERRAPLAS